MLESDQCETPSRSTALRATERSAARSDVGHAPGSWSWRDGLTARTKNGGARWNVPCRHTSSPGCDALRARRGVYRIAGEASGDDGHGQALLNRPGRSRGIVVAPRTVDTATASATRRDGPAAALPLQPVPDGYVEDAVSELPDAWTIRYRPNGDSRDPAEKSALDGRRIAVQS